MHRFLLIAVCLGTLIWVGCTSGQFEVNSECNEDSDCGPDELCDSARDQCLPRNLGPGGTGGSGGNGGGGSGAGGRGGMPVECMRIPDARVIGDEVFDNTNWSATETHTDGATVETDPTRQEQLDGVDNSPYRSMTHEITTPAVGELGCPAADNCSFTMVVSHQFTGQTYTPVDEGAIDYIDYSESRIITEPAFAGAGVGWTFVVWQEPLGGGEPVRYRVPGTAFSDVTWSSESLCGLTAQDFGPEGLNFEDGGTMMFGYSRSNTHTTPDSTQRSVHGIDNFRVAIVKK